MSTPAWKPSFPRSELARLKDIRLAADLAREFAKGMSFDTFEQDLKTIAAVERQLMIVGEASAHLSDEMRSKVGDLPWPKIVGIRHILVHEYQRKRPDL